MLDPDARLVWLPSQRSIRLWSRTRSGIDPAIQKSSWMRGSSPRITLPSKWLCWFRTCWSYGQGAWPFPLPAIPALPAKGRAALREPFRVAPFGAPVLCWPEQARPAEARAPASEVGAAVRGRMAAARQASMARARCAALPGASAAAALRPAVCLPALPRAASRPAALAVCLKARQQEGRAAEQV